LAAALLDRDAVTAALANLLEQLSAADDVQAIRDALADAAELLDDLAPDVRGPRRLTPWSPRCPT